MRCPRCKSPRIQRGFHDAPLLFRVFFVHALLCNKCGLEFKGFDPLQRLERAPSLELEAFTNRRRVPRYRAHLPASISLIEETTATGKVSYSQPSRGHCESISKAGLMLAFVGTRFPEEELCRAGRLLFVTVDLPIGPIDAVVSILTYERPGREENKAKWLVGASIYQMSEADTVRLATYLDKRAEEEPLLVSD